MNKTILIAGFGPGISSALAERFGKEGFQLALVARNAERLAAGVKALDAKGIRARAFPADLGDAGQARAVVGSVRKAMGPIDAIAWVAYNGTAGDLLTAESSDVSAALGIATTSLIAVTKEALPDLRERKGAVLVSNGGLGLFDEKVDAAALRTETMGLAMANSAKHKLVGLLAQRLRPEGIYVGELMVLGLVKGTAFDQGGANLEASAVASRFWDMYASRSQTYAQVG